MTPTPGYKTSEFWLSLGAAVVGALLASGLPSDSIAMRIAGAAALALNSLGYTLARSTVKRAEASVAPARVTAEARVEVERKRASIEPPIYGAGSPHA